MGSIRVLLGCYIASGLGAGMRVHVQSRLEAPALSAPAPSLISPQVPVVSVSAVPSVGARILSDVERSVALISAARNEGEQERALANIFEPVPLADGTQVGPQVTADTVAHDRELSETRAALGQAVATAQPALERSVWHGGWRGPRIAV
jgi:hypothetical protein